MYLRNRRVRVDKYIYRFLDKKSEVIYIGKTNNLTSRIKSHFTNGHLKGEDYAEVERVEYITLPSDTDQYIAEIYLINKYKPKLNTRDKRADTLNLKTNIPSNWTEFKNFTFIDDGIKDFFNSFNINIPPERQNITFDILSSEIASNVKDGSIQEELKEVKEQNQDMKEQLNNLIDLLQEEEAEKSLWERIKDIFK